jgi:hypothetical protein
MHNYRVTIVTRFHSAQQLQGSYHQHLSECKTTSSYCQQISQYTTTGGYCQQITWCTTTGYLLSVGIRVQNYRVSTVTRHHNANYKVATVSSAQLPVATVGSVTYCAVCVSWDNEECLDVVVTQVCIPLATMTWLHSIVTIKVSQCLLCDVNSSCQQTMHNKNLYLG